MGGGDDNGSEAGSEATRMRREKCVRDVEDGEAARGECALHNQAFGARGWSGRTLGSFLHALFV